MEGVSTAPPTEADLQAARAARLAKSQTDLRVGRLALFVVVLGSVVWVFSWIWALVAIVVFGLPLPFLALARSQARRPSPEEVEAIRRVPAWRDPRWRREVAVAGALATMGVMGALWLPDRLAALPFAVVVALRGPIRRWISGSRESR